MWRLPVRTQSVEYKKIPDLPIVCVLSKSVVITWNTTHLLHPFIFHWSVVDGWFIRWLSLWRWFTIIVGLSHEGGILLLLVHTREHVGERQQQQLQQLSNKRVVPIKRDITPFVVHHGHVSIYPASQQCQTPSRHCPVLLSASDGGYVWVLDWTEICTGKGTTVFKTYNYLVIALLFRELFPFQRYRQTLK